VAAGLGIGACPMTALRWAADLYGIAWDLRRRCYAAGLAAPRRLDARVVSVGNLTTGGTGKTTLVLDLIRRWRQAGGRPAIVCRRYRPGPSGAGDEELMFRSSLGSEVVFAGRSKWQLAEAAVTAGFREIVVDDGFSHWRLARDLDLVLIDARDPWGGGELLPAGRLREPHRALQRADIVVLSRLDAGEDPRPLVERLRPYAPAAEFAAGRHRVTGVRPLGDAEGGGDPRNLRFRLVTATGSPRGVERSAREAALDLVGVAAYRDHHWWSGREIAREREIAAQAGARILVTAKDAVRWPVSAGSGVWVLEIEWQWVLGGEHVLSRVRGVA